MTHVGIIGAGAAGLATAKNLKACGLSFEVLERGNHVGGCWDTSSPYSPVYDSAHLISSKPLTEFSDFRMPKDWPDYPDRKTVLKYLQSYAHHFELSQFIRFNQTVVSCSRSASGWEVRIQNGTTREFSHLVLATGLQTHPRFPENYPQWLERFDGEIIHSSQYKRPETLRDRRVLVMGAGNSGCDIAAETSSTSAVTFLSMRRGYHFLPKYIFGIPTDQIGEISRRLRIPLFLRDRMNRFLLSIVVGKPETYGLPKPDHQLLESHPIVNATLLPAIRRRQVLPKPDVIDLVGREAIFSDGTREEIDLVVCATGYSPHFPFMQLEDMNWKEDHPEFYLHLFHPSQDDLFIIGMAHPDSGVWWLMDQQARLVSLFIRAQTQSDSQLEWLRTLKAGPQPDLGAGLKYIKSPRHVFEVEHFSYSERLSHLSKQMENAS